MYKGLLSQYKRTQLFTITRKYMQSPNKRRNATLLFPELAVDSD